MHDTYYSNLPDTDVLKAELQKYVDHISDCLREDGIERDTMLDMQSQMFTAYALMRDIERIYE